MGYARQVLGHGGRRDEGGRGQIRSRRPAGLPRPVQPAGLMRSPVELPLPAPPPPAVDRVLRVHEDIVSQSSDYVSSLHFARFWSGDENNSSEGR